MFRSIAWLLAFTVGMAAKCPAADNAGSSTLPRTYELMINGESFAIEANRQVRLQSQENPGVTYDVALRIALEQRVRLNTLRFEYDWPAQAEDDRGRLRRTVRIRHELGFTMLITDLGQPLDADAQKEALRILSETTIETVRRAGAKQVRVADVPSRQFAGASGRGLVIRYQSEEGDDLTCLAYLMTGPTFAGYFVAQYSDANGPNAVPRVGKTLDSIRANR